MINNGIDLIEISRFKDIASNLVLMNKLFTKNELEYYSIHNSLQTIAGIYAAKEALLKAIGKGINDYDVKEIEINHDNSGKPFIVLNGQIKKDYQLDNLSLSISHDGLYAIAIVSFIKDMI